MQPIGRTVHDLEKALKRKRIPTAEYWKSIAEPGKIRELRMLGGASATLYLTA
jgi:hypothetical protein